MGYRFYETANDMGMAGFNYDDVVMYPFRKLFLKAGESKTVPEHEFAALLGRPIPDGSWSGTLTMNDALCQMYYAKSWPGLSTGGPACCFGM